VGSGPGTVVGCGDWLEDHRLLREQVLRKRSYLQIGWIERVLAHPAQHSVQPDGRIRFWGFVAELGRWLRVVTLEDGQTVHNAFPDRDFYPGRQP
jgi:hypothetical protein